MENTFGLSIPGHYNEVALLMRWPLSEVSLYLAMAEWTPWLNNDNYNGTYSFIKNA